MDDKSNIIPSLDELKKTHDFYVTTVQILSQRIQFFAEEFQAVTELIEFHKGIIRKIRDEIEKIEPKKDENGEGSKD